MQMMQKLHCWYGKTWNWCFVVYQSLQARFGCDSLGSIIQKLAKVEDLAASVVKEESPTGVSLMFTAKCKQKPSLNGRDILINQETVTRLEVSALENFLFCPIQFILEVLVTKLRMGGCGIWRTNTGFGTKTHSTFDSWDTAAGCTRSFAQEKRTGIDACLSCLVLQPFAIVNELLNPTNWCMR